MSSVQDERGYNQGFKPSKALEVRTFRRGQSIINELIKKEKNNVVVEIGCGTGDLSFFLANNFKGQVVGVDLSEVFITHAQKNYQRSNLRFIKLDLSKPNAWKELSNLKADYFVGNGILHHLYHDLDQVLPLLKNSLNENGKIIFWEPNLFNPYVYLIFKFSLFRKLAKLEPTEMAFTASWINKKLSSHGFEISSSVERDFFLPNTPEHMINFVEKVSNFLDKIPFINKFAQSVFVIGKK